MRSKYYCHGTPAKFSHGVQMVIDIVITS